MRPIIPLIGEVWFAGPDGDLRFHAQYETHPALRERTLILLGRVYEQASQMPDGAWVYRDREAAPKGAEHSPGLTHVRSLDLPVEPPCWADIDAWFAAVKGTSEPVPMGRVRELEALLAYVRRELGDPGV